MGTIFKAELGDHRSNTQNRVKYYREYSLGQVQKIMGGEIPPDSAAYSNPTNFAGISWPDTVKASVMGLDSLYLKARELAKATPLKNLIQVDDIRPVMRLDYEGDSVNVERFIAGDPECMGRLADTESKSTRVINLLVNFGANCGYNEKNLLERGLVIASLVQALELAGYSVGLSVGDCSNASSSDDLYQVAIKLKSPGEYLDPCLVTYYLAHPSVLRRIYFRLGEEEPMPIRKRMGFREQCGYGRSTDFNREEINQGIVIIPKIQEIGIEASKKLILNALKQQGVITL